MNCRIFRLMIKKFSLSHMMMSLKVKRNFYVDSVENLNDLLKVCLEIPFLLHIRQLNIFSMLSAESTNEET